jgi:CheY-like chemotaxis protein
MIADGLRGHKLLIVDDEPIIRTTLSIVFRKHGFVVEAVESAEAAMQLLQHWTPGIAIIDVFLPGMNGIDLALLLNATVPDCKLLLFSGSPETADLLDRASNSPHKFEVLPKPVSPELLLLRAAQLLRGRPDVVELESPEHTAIFEQAA